MLKKIILFLGVSSTILYGASRSDALECPSTVIDPGTSKTALFVCGDLPNFPNMSDLRKRLDDINFVTGDYACSYINQSGKTIQSCPFHSDTYATGLKAAHLNVYGTRDDPNQQGTSGGKAESFSLDINRDINVFNVNLSGNDASVVSRLSILSTKTQTAIKNIFRKKNKGITSVDTTLNSLLSSADRLLVDPYKNSGASTIKKDDNFALFLAGLVTLDKDVVAGYDASSGNLKVTRKWRQNAVAVGPVESTLLSDINSGVAKFVSKFIALFSFGGGKPVEKEATKNNPPLKGIMSWLDVFESKLWGFYYNWSSRLDLGYDVIGTSLLGIMLMWFMAGFGLKGGVSHILNRDAGVQATEAGVMKTVGMLLGISTFFISLPSPPAPGGAEPDFQKNRTVMKSLIRYTASEGSKWGTMMNDLGLRAYADFYIKKQFVYTTKEVMRTYQDGAYGFTTYFPARAVSEECRAYYDATDGDLYNTIKLDRLTAMKESDAMSRSFFSSNKISSISKPLCQKAVRVSALAPYEAALIFASVQEEINKHSKVMAKAAKMVLENEMLLSAKMGWVSTISIPVGYFLTKEAGLFLDPGMNIENVTDAAKSFSSGIGMQNDMDLEKSLPKDRWDRRKGYDDDVVGTGSTGTSQMLSEFFGYLTGKTAYMMLPGFSGIFKTVNGFFRDAYTYNLLDKNGGMSGFFSWAKKKGGALMGKVIGKLGVVGKFLSFITDALSGGMLGKALMSGFFMILSLSIAIMIWNMAYTTIFMVSIMLMLLLKTTMYFKDLLIHFTVSPFVALWALSSSKQGNGENVMLGFLRDTLVLMIYPTIIVVSGYLFIFVYELFYTVYILVGQSVIEDLRSNVSLVNAVGGAGSVSGAGAFGAYYNLKLVEEFMGIFLKFFGLILAYLVIFKMPETLLAKIGMGNANVNVTKHAEIVSQKGDRHVNPILA